MVNSKEKLTAQGVFQDNPNFDRESEVQSILSDFYNLDFSNGPFNYPLYDMNYNEGKEANPFDKIAKYYGRNKNVFLFISLLRDKEESERIIDIISKKCDVKAKEKFTQRMKIYLDRISEGECDAKEFLNSDLVAFFNGYHVSCPAHERNVHANLNINIAEPRQILGTTSYFSRTTNRISEQESEIKRAKIYINGKRVVTVEKNEKQQRNYSFTQFAMYDIEISWSVWYESKKDLNCAVVLNINSGQISIGKSTVDGKCVGLKEISELAKQNDAVLIKRKALHEVLAKNLIEQTPSEE